jgi:hypothetical protein
MLKPCQILLTTQGWFKTILGVGIISLLFISCQKENCDSTPYPSLITEFVNLRTDEHGTAVTFHNDQGEVFNIDNQIENLYPNATYRIVCGYEVTDKSTKNAIIYKVKNVEVLKEQSTTRCDALNVIAVWMGGNFINLHLNPKTQGGEHEWGYHLDRISSNREQKVYHLSLFHNQKEDPTSYTEDIYACINLSQLTGIQSGDSIYISIQTFEKDKTWCFQYH